MRILGIALSILVSSGAGFAQTDIKSCVRIENDLRRLNCYDSYFRSTTNVPAGSAARPLTFVDFVTDFNDLIGKDIQVKGFGLMLGEHLVVYQEAGSLNGFFVNIERLARNNKRELLMRCGSGCDVIVSGTARKVMMQHGIVASSVSFE